MKYFRYGIAENEIAQSLGETDGIPSDFIEYTVNPLGESVYYLIKNGKLKEMVSEGATEETAKGHVEEFLVAFNVNRV